MNLLTSKVIAITNVYPNRNQPELGVFVQSFFQALTLHNHEVQVIAPHPIIPSLIKSFHKNGKTQFNGANIKTIRPGYFSLPVRLLPWGYIGAKINLFGFRNAVMKCRSLFQDKPDWAYAHFFSSGWAAIDICEKNKIPCFVALGESEIQRIERIFGEKVFISTLKRFSGIITVSKENERFCRLKIPEIGNKLLYLPNAVNLDVFHPYERNTARKALGLPIEGKLVIFCGHFIARKGPQKVLDAINLLDDVKGVFLGQGPEVPAGKNVLFAGPVEHDSVPLWISACDIFILPSLAEGMSNAIIEALSCGIPTIVSDRKFNRDFLSEESTLFVDPQNPQEIAVAIKKIFDNEPLRNSMAESAQLHAAHFSLSHRAQAMIEFVEAHK